MVSLKIPEQKGKGVRQGFPAWHLFDEQNAEETYNQ